ncbi:MAG: glycosyltransferase [Phycisphaerales bacterium]
MRVDRFEPRSGARSGSFGFAGDWSAAARGHVTAPSRIGRVLLLSASVGSGHMRAAEAIAAALQARAVKERLSLDRVDVVDVLDDATPWFRSAYRGTYLGLLDRAPAVVGWLYRRSDRPYRGAALRWPIAHLNLRALRTRIRQLDPDIIVSTHFLPSEYLAGLRRRQRLRARLATVVTDVHVHGMWLANPTDHYFVASDEGADSLMKNGVSAARIDVTGIPIHPAFSDSCDRAEARRRHDLEPDGRVVLFTTGGCCVGPVTSLFRQLLTLRTPCTLVAVCGRSEASRIALEHIASGANPRGPVKPRVLGFTPKLHELMAAADLLVGKPGGLTSSEARARGLPMVIVHAVPGQEEHNAAALLARGCAIRCPDATSVAPRIDELLTDDAALERMRSRALATAQAGAAFAIVDRLAATRI